MDSTDLRWMATGLILIVSFAGVGFPFFRDAIQREAVRSSVVSADASALYRPSGFSCAVARAGRRRGILAQCFDDLSRGRCCSSFRNLRDGYSQGDGG